MPLKFHRTIEQQHFNKETNDFIKTELAHARRQVRAFRETFGPSARETSPRDVEFADSAHNYLLSLEAAFAVAEGPIKHGRPNEFRDRFLAEFPEIIANFATAVYQRQEELPYRFFTTRAPESRFAPSELALEYAVTIRAAEAVSAEYHDRLRRLYPGATECRAPLVALSGGPVAALRAHIDLCRGNPALACPVPITPAALIEVLRHCQNLSCIRLPRWSSQHIRTYALAAHEHMHRVQHSSTIITREAKAAFTKRRESQGAESSIDAIWSSDQLSDETRLAALAEFISDIETYAQAVGNDLAVLTVAGYELFHDLWRLYRQHARVEDRPFPQGPQAITECEGVPIVAGVPVPHRDGNPAERDFEIWRSVAQFHAREFLADIGAVLIAGPAFVLAFRTVHPIADPKGGVAPGNRSHPSTNLRVWLHIALLRRLEFRVLAGLIEDDLRDEWGELAQGPELEQACKTFVDTLMQPGGTVDHLIEHLTDASDTAYNLQRRREQDAPRSSEAALLDHWTDIARAVEVDRHILSADVTAFAPPDTINAIWWKRIAEQSEDPETEARNRLAWRVALRNHGRLTEGA
jgi:hypothetical protein